MLMFLKERTAPDLLDTLPRLMQRLPKGHPGWEDVFSDHYKIRAGFGGEKHVDRLLRRMRGHEAGFVIADLQLRERFCQMDTVLLMPYGAVVLEVKNYSGTLSFDEDSLHMTQKTRDGKFFGFNSPVTQAWNAREELLRLFEELAVSLPVYAAVVLPYSSTLIERAPKEIPVIYGYSLNRFLSNLPRTGRPMPPEELARVGQFLIDCHTPFPKTDYSHVYKYEVKDLKKGVLCGSCGSCCVRQSQRTYFCVPCQSAVLEGYARAMDDWFEFVAPEITNRQCREFLGLKDKYAARYLLQKLGFASRGASVQRIYWKE